MGYKELLHQFLVNESNRRLAAPIALGLIRQYNWGPVSKIKRSGISGVADKMPWLVDFLVSDALAKKRYTASTIPTTISVNMAPNFYVGREAPPDEEEMYKFLYLLLTGLWYQEYVVNLDNVDSIAIDEFRKDLINNKLLILPETEQKGGIDVGAVLRNLGMRTIPMTEFTFPFVIVSYFASWIRRLVFSNRTFLENLKKMGIEYLLGEELKIGDAATLIIFRLPQRREKREMYIVPKVKDFVVRWYGDYIEGRTHRLHIVNFLCSMYISNKKYKEVSLLTINKFLYYFMCGYLSGDLLEEMIKMKSSYELGEKRVYGFHDADRFFNMLR